MPRPGSLLPIHAQGRESLRRAGVLTALGVAGLAPAFIRVGTGLVGGHPPPVLVHPVLVLGGLLEALAVSFVAVTHWERRSAPGVIRVICTIRKRPGDLAVFFVGLVLLAVILGDRLVEHSPLR